MAIITCFLISITKAPARSSCHRRHTMIIHQRVAIGVVVLLMLLLLKLHPSKIVNASASTNVSLKTTLWLLPVAVPSTCKSILTITTWSSHTSNISHHVIGHIISQAYPSKTSQTSSNFLLHVLRGCYGYLVWSHLTYAKTTTEMCKFLFNLSKDRLGQNQFI